jgi:hypothetical protein
MMNEVLRASVPEKMYGKIRKSTIELSPVTGARVIPITPSEMSMTFIHYLFTHS